MSKSVVLTLESRFMDEYGEYANLPVFNAHGSIVGYVGGEVPESGNPCEFNRLNDEGFTFCASATEVVRLKAENAKLREQLADAPKCEACEAMLDCDECLRADSSQKERRRLSYENAKLRELVRDLWLTGGLCDAIPDMRLQAKGGDWRTMQERVYEALGIEVDA